MAKDIFSFLSLLLFFLCGDNLAVLCALGGSVVNPYFNHWDSKTEGGG